MVAASRPQVVRLRSGDVVRIRQVRPGDVQALARAYARLGEESRYRRFFTARPELSDSFLHAAAEVDHENHEALVALPLLSGEIVGECRFVRLPDRQDTADLAVTVVDAWQGREHSPGTRWSVVEAICLLTVAAGQARSVSPSLRTMPRTDARPLPRPRVPDRTETADLRVAVRSDSPLVVEIHGEIDIQSAPGLRDELLRVIRRYGAQLALDLTGVTFMDCAGLNVLLATRRRARLEEGSVRVIRASPRVLRMISLLGLEKAFALG